jgi:hypothetical protein
MKRFLSVSLALFLGLISATEVVDSNLFLTSVATPTTTANETVVVETKSDTKTVVIGGISLEEASEDLQRLNCLLYNDLTFFDLRSLETGNPYDVSNYNFTFCQRQKDADGNKAFAYLTVADVNGVEDAVRLTDGNRPSNVKAVLD